MDMTHKFLPYWKKLYNIYFDSIALVVNKIFSNTFIMNLIKANGMIFSKTLVTYTT